VRVSPEDSEDRGIRQKTNDCMIEKEGRIARKRRQKRVRKEKIKKIETDG
jgi:hypothetical protein